MASSVQEPGRVEFGSGVDGIAGLAQAKIAYQRMLGDVAGAEETEKRFWTFSLGASQFASLRDVYHGNFQQAKLRQQQFMEGASKMLKAVPESMPLLGHIVGGVYCCAGNREHGKHVFRRATRSCCVCAPGLLIGGASVAMGITPHGLTQNAVMTAAAGIAGVAAGMQADVRLFLRSIPPQVGLTPGERFDLFVLRCLDAAKAVSCMDLVPILYPDSVEQVSVWVEPLTAQEAAHLLTGIKQWPGLDQLDTGALHSFVVLKTSKGHIFVTERLHDGQIVLGDATATSVHHYADGQAMLSQGQLANGDALVLPPMAERLAMATENGAQLYAVKEVAGGPSVASLTTFAQAQSRIDYDLLSSNCQHYANSVLEFASGKGLTYMPNADLMALSALLMPPAPTMPFTNPGFFSTLAYEASQAPVRAACDAAVIACPRDPLSFQPVQVLPTLQQLPLAELERQLQEMPLQQRERLQPEQLQQLVQQAAAQGAPQMQGHRMDEPDPEVHVQGSAEPGAAQISEASA